MKTLLRIDSSLRLKNSYSRNVGDNFVQAWKELNPGGSISIREVGTSHIPHLEQEVLEKFYTSGDTFGIPSSLKAYFDLVLRKGKTFRYEEGKAIGLLHNKITYILSAMGEIKSDMPNLVELHLQQILNFIGIRVRQQLNHQKELFTNILSK